MGFLRTESSDNPYIDYDSITPAWLVENARILAENATATNGTASSSKGGGIDWTLQNCCDKNEFTLIGLMGGYLLIIAILWSTVLMKPLKLIAVFVHEFSHALACWMTGGKVTGIEVKSNEGGVTKYVGGWRICIIPAGYIGGSFWGAFFIVLSGDRTASLIAAILFCVALLFSMKFSPNKTMVLLNLVFVAITVTFIVIDRFVMHPFLQYLTLFYGVFISSFSIFDIYDDLITRTVEGSDAHACHKLIPCCFPKCVGVQFALVALAWQGVGIYLALVWMSSV